MQIAVLPDAARVEERLARLARQRGFVAGKVACSLAELERGVVREAQQAGACPQIASPFALQLALREAARTHSPGPYFAIRNHAGYARALGDLLSALTHGLLPPLELTSRTRRSAPWLSGAPCSPRARRSTRPAWPIRTWPSASPSSTSSGVARCRRTSPLPPSWSSTASSIGRRCACAWPSPWPTG